jgi:glucose/arabinose dehydrogenase
VEQGGRILQVAGGTTTPVLDISDRITSGGERGLLGLAFSPDGTHAYVNFTDTNGNTVVAEIAVSADGLAFDGDNMRPIITIDQPYSNHNGGDLAIGPDGLLYIGMGDGGSGGDPERHSLVLDDLLGKVLRIDPTPSGDLGYTIPADNPFVGVDGARGEIWSVGLRNPWRLSFDAETGDLWIADVGQNATEEVNVAAATDGLDAGRGSNFGWSAYEGNDEFNADQLAAVTDHHAPIHTYSHDSGRCSVSGGVRARGAGAGGFAGWYVFADYCSGEVFALQPADDLASARVITVASAGSVTAVTAGSDGTVYVLDDQGVHALTTG